MPVLRAEALEKPLLSAALLMIVAAHAPSDAAIMSATNVTLRRGSSAADAAHGARSSTSWGEGGAIAAVVDRGDGVAAR